MEPAPQGASEAAADEPRLQPVIPDDPAKAPWTPAPNQMIMKPPSRQQAALRGTVAGVALVALVVNVVFTSRFPGNAPVEWLYAAGVTIDLAAITVVLGVFAILAAVRRSVPVKPQSMSPLAVAAIILAAVALVAWIVFSLFPTLTQAAGSVDGRWQYMNAVGAIFLFGPLWVLGVIFGTLSLRSGGRRTPVLAWSAMAIGLVLTVIAVGSAVLYGLALTD